MESRHSQHIHYEKRLGTSLWWAVSVHWNVRGLGPAHPDLSQAWESYNCCQRVSSCGWMAFPKGPLPLENIPVYSHISLIKGSMLVFTLCSLHTELGFPDDEHQEKAIPPSCISLSPFCLEARAILPHSLPSSDDHEHLSLCSFPNNLKRKHRTHPKYKWPAQQGSGSPLKAHRTPQVGKWVSMLVQCPLPPLFIMSPRRFIRALLLLRVMLSLWEWASAFVGFLTRKSFLSWPRRTPAPAKSLRPSPWSSEQSHRGTTPSTSSSPERRCEKGCPHSGHLDP